MTEMYIERELPAPSPNPGDEEFFNAAARGELLVKRCADCGELHYYPRAVCPICLSSAVEWHLSSGKGWIYSFSVTRRAKPGPYCIAYIKLDEGITILSGIVDCDLDSLKIGDRVNAVFKQAAGGFVVPMFAPAHNQEV